jgi:energy-coupling factor transport system substrate-specific component
MKKKSRIWFYLGLIFGIIILNFLGGFLATMLQIPFFLDTWATSLGVMVGGLWVGVIGGTLYNIFMSVTIWPFEWWIFFLSSIWVAVSTYFLFKKGWIDIGNPFKMIGSGILIGVTNAIVNLVIHYFAFGFLPTYPGSAPTYELFLRLTNSSGLAIFFEKMITEISDKTVSIFLAAIAINYIPRRWMD